MLYLIDNNMIIVLGLLGNLLVCKHWTNMAQIRNISINMSLKKL